MTINYRNPWHSGLNRKPYHVIFYSEVGQDRLYHQSFLSLLECSFYLQVYKKTAILKKKNQQQLHLYSQKNAEIPNALLLARLFFLSFLPRTPWLPLSSQN